jgi:hypothetical protein
MQAILKYDTSKKPMELQVWVGDKMHFSGEPKKAKKVAEDLNKYLALRG